jgi:vancomycin resistance protein YoaR
LIIIAGIGALAQKHQAEILGISSKREVKLNLVGDVFPFEIHLALDPDQPDAALYQIPLQISQQVFFSRSDLSDSISFGVECGINAEYWQINLDKLAEFSQYDSQLNTLSAISDNPNIDEDFRNCLKVSQDYRIAYYAFLKLDNTYQPNKLLTYVNSKWQIDPGGGFYDLVSSLKASTDQELIEPIYKVKNNQILLLANYREGRVLNIDSTYNAIARWLTEPNADVPIQYEITQPQMRSLPYPVLDFTQFLGEGNTRMVLNNANGVYDDINDFIIYGLQDLQDLIVQPGQTISYIDLVNPNRSQQLKNGNYVGDGICMATTTLFRAVLNSGLDIVDRSSHGKNYPSYAWGDDRYPYNLVDAAYYTSPVVDFKFRNNTNYPVLISVVVERKEGYQYHKVVMLGSSQEPSRTVEFANWQVNMNGNTIRTGSFDRIVKVNDEVLEQKTFTSQYY